MASAGNTDAEREFWEEFDRALQRAGNPSAAKISRDIAATVLDKDVSESTLRDWIRYRRLPRTADKLMIMMRVIGAEHRRDWTALLERAQNARAHAAANPPEEGAPETAPPDQLSAPEPAQSDQPTQGASGQADELAEVVTPPPETASRRRRTIWWWTGGLTVAAVAATAGFVFGRPDGADHGRATPSTADAVEPPMDTSKRGVPCRRSGDQVGAPESSPSASPEPRPTAYANGGAGRAELVREQRQFVLTDDLGDGCSTILTVKADGAEMGPWANSWGKTGKVKNGRTIPPKPIDAPWLDRTRQVGFRVCVGEVVDGEIVFQETDCGHWVTMRL
jgi:hypothetical protein